MSRQQTLVIDTSLGGLGDVWMRLHALHALAALRSIRVIVKVAPALEDAATATFGERLELERDLPRGAFAFTHLGVVDLAPGILAGRRFINPFHRANALHPDAGWKQGINRLAFSTVAATGRVVLSDDSFNESYSGWMQISALRQARGLPKQAVLEQFEADFPLVRARLRAGIPEVESSDITVFPSGTSFQVMPPQVALEVLPDARFAFHQKDRYSEAFRNVGLNVVHFSDTKGLLQLASSSGRAFCTDSFPSHVLQTYSNRTVLMLSHYPRRRIVHPSFDGGIIDSAAPCCPCITRARVSGSSCPAGKPFCMTWDDMAYRNRLKLRRNEAEPVSSKAGEVDGRRGGETVRVAAERS